MWTSTLPSLPRQCHRGPWQCPSQILWWITNTSNKSCPVTWVHRTTQPRTNPRGSWVCPMHWQLSSSSNRSCDFRGSRWRERGSGCVKRSSWGRKLLSADSSPWRRPWPLSTHLPWPQICGPSPTTAQILSLMEGPIIQGSRAQTVAWG